MEGEQIQYVDRGEIHRSIDGQTGDVGFGRALRSAATPHRLVWLLGQYVQFNRVFGCGVAALAASIGDSFDLFYDDQEKIPALADRSMDVAAAIFTAAVDEFGYREKGRLSHRKLAQETFRATASYFAIKPALANELGSAGEKTLRLIDRVRVGYGLGTKGDAHRLLSGIGFHLSSELMADNEFCTLDHFLRERHAGLVEYLRGAHLTTLGTRATSYSWINVHTNIEAEHAELALSGANLALKYLNRRVPGSTAKEWIIEGAHSFAVLQNEFMGSLCHGLGGESYH